MQKDVNNEIRDPGFHAHLQSLLLSQDETAARSIFLSGLALRDVAGVCLITFDQRDEQPLLLWGEDLSGNLHRAQLSPEDIIDGSFRDAPRWLSLWLFRRKNPVRLSQLLRYVPFSGLLLKRAMGPPGVRPIEDFVCIPYRHHEMKCLLGIGFFHLVSESLMEETVSLALAYMVKWESTRNDATDSGAVSDETLELTTTELECLKWMAAGKTLHEISDITGMSYPNVRYHLNKAKERSGYATTQQLMVRAALDYELHPLGPDIQPGRPH